MQKNICRICLQPVELDTDILQPNDDIKCVHYSCLSQSQVSQRILAQMSYQDQSDEHEAICNTCSLKLSKRPAIHKFLPSKQNSTPRCTSTRSINKFYPVQEYSVDHEVYRRTSKSISKTYSNPGSTKWFSSMRKNSYKIMPLFIRNKRLLCKGQQYEIPQNKQGEETTVFPLTINASNVYSSEILDWLATPNNDVPSPVLEKPIPQAVPNSRQQKKKVTIQDTRDPYLTEHRSRDYRKSLQRRASRRKREIPSSSIGSQYSNHSARLNAADFMDWVTSAPKIPNGNMLILLDCRNKKDTKNVGVQPSFNDPERNAARKTAESLILDLLEGRRNDQYEYYSTCQGQGSNVTLVKTCTTESRITTSLQERDHFHEAIDMEEPTFIFAETVEERMHHVVSIVFNALSHFSGMLGRFTKVMKDEFTSSDKNVNLDQESKVLSND